MAEDFFDVFKRNSLRQVKLMLEAGHDVNARNKKMETPLMACIKYCLNPNCRASILKLLLESGADINLRNSQGQTALIYSCILNQLDSVVILLQKQSLDINQSDNDGNTALMYACNLGFPEIAAVLLESHRLHEHYIDLNKQNYDKYTALDHAVDRGRFNIVRLFANLLSIPECYLKEGSQASAPKLDALLANDAAQPKQTTLRFVEEVRASLPSEKPDSSAVLPKSMHGSEQQSKSMNDSSSFNLSDSHPALTDGETDEKHEIREEDVMKKGKEMSDKKESAQIKMDCYGELSTNNEWYNKQQNESSCTSASQSMDNIRNGKLIRADESKMSRRKSKSFRKRDVKKGNCKSVNGFPVGTSNNQDSVNYNDKSKKSLMNFDVLASSDDLKVRLNKLGIYMGNDIASSGENQNSKPSTPSQSELVKTSAKFSQDVGLSQFSSGDNISEHNSEDDITCSYRLQKTVREQFPVHGKPLPKIPNGDKHK